MAHRRINQIFKQLNYGPGPPELSNPALSLLHGPTEPALLEVTLGQLLDREVERNGNRTCCVSPATVARLTYTDLDRESRLLARGLIAHGIKKGDHIGILAAIVSDMWNCTYIISEVQRALEFSDCKMLFTSPTIGSDSKETLISTLVGSISPSSTLREVCIIRPNAKLKISGTVNFEKLKSDGRKVSVGSLSAIETQLADSDVCNLQFTSGTTGEPKAAMLTHHGIINNGFFVGERMKLTELDVLCCSPPLFHCFGLVLGLLACISHGSNIVLPSETFSPATTLKAISDEGCTAVHGVPAMFVADLRTTRPKNFDCSKLRTGIAAGAPVPPALMRDIRTEFNLQELTNTYGMTETSPASFMTSTDDSLEHRLETVGKIMPHTTVKVIDSDGNIVKRGVPGELCVAGYLLQKGYYNNQAKTAEVMTQDKDGIMWMHTGDEVVIDEEGYCRVTGWIKDIIIRGGENVYPLEIQNRLLEHITISQASVVGVEHKRLGEVVGAFLQLREGFSRPSLKELRDFVAVILAGYKSPAHVFWLGDEGVGDTLPITGSGKVKKTVLRKVANGLVAKSTSRSA